jgi:hypothetical protein
MITEEWVGRHLEGRDSGVIVGFPKTFLEEMKETTLTLT